MSMFDDVGEFHRKFGLPVTNLSRRCAPMSDEDRVYRTLFLEEELNEFKLACAQGDLAGTVDALVDLAWVALGTIHYLGAPGNAAWAEVVRANMEKVRGQPGDGGHRRGGAEPIRKPAGWRAPDIAKVIAQHSGDA